MFQSFTGNSRRPRQVNLSGRSINPFAAVSGAPTSKAPLNSHDAIAHAQQERRARQQERDRLQAAKRLQRIWRGHATRKEIATKYRKEWDFREGIADTALITRDGQYTSAADALAQLNLLLQFASSTDLADLRRVQRFAAKSAGEAHDRPTWVVTGRIAHEWTYSLLRAAKLCLAMIHRSCTMQRMAVDSVDDLLLFLSEISKSIPEQLSTDSHTYYKTIRLLLESTADAASRSKWYGNSSLTSALTTLLEPDYRNTIAAYESFVEDFLPTAELQRHLDLNTLADSLDAGLLTTAYKNKLATESRTAVMGSKTNEELYWLLAYFVHFRRTIRNGDGYTSLPNADYVMVVSRLLSCLPENIGSHIEALGGSPAGSLPLFVSNELSTLVNQESITSLLYTSESTPMIAHSHQGNINVTAALASYALTLLRVFPRRGDEIRMWLYLGSTSRWTRKLGSAGDQLPAIKYFWDAVSRTETFRLISRHPQNVIPLLKTRNRSETPQNDVSIRNNNTWEQEWRIILLFLELYTFVLKVTDDEEFMNGADSIEDHQSWTRRSALKLIQVKELTIFLKHLAFSMYWNAAKMIGVEEQVTTTSLAEYFGHTSVASPITINADAAANSEDTIIAGVSGMSLNYMKGMVTGLLRMIYERDSRRKFLPEDHWLMTSHFDMRGFVRDAVTEEVYKHQNQDADEEEEDILQIDSDEDSEEQILVGTHRTQQVRRIERLKRQQRKTARRKQLGAVTPRLEILQNMPFFIPFSIRVEIFHQFVYLDQSKRRGGSIDADTWRMMLMHNARSDRRAGHEELGKHSARIRRENCFDDAFEQFYELGDGLKEPIQISFVDQFGAEEAGIDGGGVTKEFLASITSEAFTPSPDSRLFVENDQHLLYPNPAAVDERKAYLRHLGFQEGSLEWNEPVRELLRRYEFLGRVVGKCLYEGILIDVHFAPFFLVKWALSGGSGSATNESNYRASINDLRDLDEGLYQGLLQLKNYPGNVEDFSLDFTITDTISVPSDDDMFNGQPSERNITRELRKNGSQMPVTNENRLVYISDVARHRLQIQPHLQTSAFLRGLGSMIQPSWLSMFNQSELQTLIGGGSSEIDVSDLRRNTLYGGVYVIGDDNEEHPTVKMFWKVMQEFSDADRRKVLKYVTSTPRAPILGFRQLNPPFSIRDSGSDQTRLPSTSTCVNLLKLPMYTNEEILRLKLRYAINAGAGFNLS